MNGKFAMLPRVIMGYVLELNGGNWYIGVSEHLNTRLAQHMSGYGSRWSKMHGVKRLEAVKVLDTYNSTWEDTTTIIYMQKYGFQKVRGGSYCRIKMDSPPKSLRVALSSDGTGPPEQWIYHTNKRGRPVVVHS